MKLFSFSFDNRENLPWLKGFIAALITNYSLTIYNSFRQGKEFLEISLLVVLAILLSIALFTISKIIKNYNHSLSEFSNLGEEVTFKDYFEVKHFQKGSGFRKRHLYFLTSSIISICLMTYIFCRNYNTPSQLDLIHKSVNEIENKIKINDSLKTKIIYLEKSLNREIKEVIKQEKVIDSLIHLKTLNKKK